LLCDNIITVLSCSKDNRLLYLIFVVPVGLLNLRRT